MHLSAFNVAVLAVSLSLLACGDHRPTADRASPTLRRGLGGEPGSLDPATAGDSFAQEVLGDLYEGLVAQAPDGSLVPGVAESWSVDATGRIVTFRLRHAARWSNGQPVKASDFVRAWRRVVAPATGSPVADNLRLIAGATDIIAGRASPTTLGVTAPQDDELVVHLSQPAPYVFDVLTHYSTFPEYSDEAVASRGGPTWVSNGAYVLENWRPGNALTLSRNPAYWNRAQVTTGHVVYVPVSDEHAELRRYRADQLDVTESIPVSDLLNLQKERPIELHISPLLATAYYAFNLHRGVFAHNRDLRQALAMAINRPALLALVLPLAPRPAYGIVPPGTANYTPQSWPWQELSEAERIAEAQRLYRLAGYSVQSPLQVRLLLNSDTTIKQMAIAIAAMWKETLGIDTEFVVEEYRVFLESRHDVRRWDVVRLGWTADYNDAGNFLDTFRANSPNNDSGWSNPNFDDLLDQAAATPDAEHRRRLLEQAEALMLADYPVIPINFFNSRRLFKPYVTGEAANPLNRLYSEYLHVATH